jgi:hypothetical protein
MNSSATPIAPRSALLNPRVLLLGVTLAGLLLFALFPRLQAKMGLFDYGRWFLDTYAILASNDAVRAGMDPFQPNPLDDLLRPHSYSHWWFGLGRLGLTRADNFLVGGISVLAFLVTALAALRPRSRWEAAAQALVLLSPPVLLAIMRANNDLVVFAVLATGLMLVRSPATGRMLALLAAVAVATGLKFYPAVAAAGLLLVRPPRRLAWGAVLAALVLAAVVANVWADFGRAVIPVPSNVYSFGAPLVMQDLGWGGRGAQAAATAVLLLLGVLFRRVGFAGGLTREGTDFPDRMRFIMAAVLLVACFLAGISYAYRWVFAIWLVPWLWGEARGVARDPRRTGGRLTLGLLFFAVWSDGIFCLVVNLAQGPMSPAALDHLQLCWRFASQPFIWLLMGLLTGALLDAGVSAWRDWRAESARG